MPTHDHAFLAAARSYAYFMWVVAQIHPAGTPGYRKINRAARETLDLFGSYRRSNGEFYFTHCFAVALIAIVVVGVTDVDTIVTCIIHDNREYVQEKMDEGTCLPHSRYWADSVEDRFGYRVEENLAGLTAPRVFSGRTSLQSHELYGKRFEEGGVSSYGMIIAKLCDRVHNMWTLHRGMSPDKIREKIEETVRYYLPLARRHGILVEELLAAIAAAEAMLAEMEIA